jgi:hypothetical protein
MRGLFGVTVVSVSVRLKPPTMPLVRWLTLRVTLPGLRAGVWGSRRLGAVRRNWMLRRLAGSGAPPSAKLRVALGTLSALLVRPRAMVPVAGGV